MEQRDHLLFPLLYNTGARVSEITGARVGDVVLDDGAARTHLRGKGRKERSVPLWRSTVKTIRAWLRLNPQFDAASALLPNRNGCAMTRTNVAKRLALAVKAATTANPVPRRPVREGRHQTTLNDCGELPSPCSDPTRRGAR